MLERLRGRLSYANVVATLALFVALGGSSYAALHHHRQERPRRVADRQGASSATASPAARSAKAASAPSPEPATPPASAD